MSDWTRRAYNATTDEDAIVFLWLKSYAHAKTNRQKGANKDASPAERKYWRKHAPIVETLLKGAETVVLCDPERSVVTAAGPPVIWAYACFTGDVVHYVGVKRIYAKAGFGPEMVADLLGDRLTRPCEYSHELVEMIPVRDKDGVFAPPCGVTTPSMWSHDDWWLARELVGGARAA